MSTDVAATLDSIRPSTLGAPAQTRTETSHRLRGVVLLGGTVRQTELSRSIGRAVLDLPVRAGVSVLEHWRAHAAALAAAQELSELPIRVMIDRLSVRPTVVARAGVAPVSVESDAVEFRGTGGLLRDLARGYDPDDAILVANAGQVLLRPLPELFRALAQAGGDINLISHADGTPVGLMLVTCRALAAIKDKGFVDFKEQALPELAKRFDVRVVTESGATARPIRTLGAYLTALWLSHRGDHGAASPADPFVEDWSETFGIVEPGAAIDPSARVHDSVVLAGARVGAGAVLVRSLVCAGAVVRPGEVVCDQIVTSRRIRDRILRR